MPDVLSYLGEVVVQDACELLSSDDTQVRAAAEANPVHAFLLESPRFRWGWKEGKGKATIACVTDELLQCVNALLLTSVG
jgi:hypothetical protein